MSVRNTVPTAPPEPANWHSFEVQSIKITREPYMEPTGEYTSVPNPRVDGLGQLAYRLADGSTGWIGEGEEVPEGAEQLFSEPTQVPVERETQGYIRGITITEEDSDGVAIDRSNPLYPAFLPFTHEEIKDLPEYEAFKVAGYHLAAAAYAHRASQ